MYAAMELLDGIMISFYENGEFKEILGEFRLKLVDMCTKILHDFE